MKTRSKIIVLLGVILSLTLIITVALAIYRVNIRGKGTIFVTTVDIGIYKDENCTTPLTELNWGTLTPGDTKTKPTKYIRNEGNTPLSLTLSTTNWTPTEAEAYIGLTWNYDNSSISVGDVIGVKFTLSVSSSWPLPGITDFEFDIVITAEE